MVVPPSGQALGAFADSLSYAAQTVAGVKRQQNSAKFAVNSSKALTFLQEQHQKRFLEYNNNWDALDATGKKNYRSYLEDYDKWAEGLKEDIDSFFDGSSDAERFFPVFNELISDGRMQLTEKVNSYERGEIKQGFVEVLNARAAMQGEELEDRLRNLGAEIQQGVDTGIISEAEAQELRTTYAQKAAATYAMEGANQYLQEGDILSARAFIRQTPGLSEEDREDMVKDVENEWTFLEKVREKQIKEMGENEYREVLEGIELNKINTEDALSKILDPTEGSGRHIDVDKQASLYALLERHKEDGENGTKTPAASNNELGRMMLNRTQFTRADIERRMQQLLEDGKLSSADYLKYFKQMDSEDPALRHLNDAGSKRVLAILDANLDSELITPEMAADIESDYYNWLTNNAWSRDGKFVIDAKFTDNDKLQWINNRLDPQIKEAIGWTMRRSTRDKRLTSALQAGKGTGLFANDVIHEYLSFPAKFNRDEFRDKVSLAMFEKDYDRLDDRQQEIVDNNEELYDMVLGQKDRAIQELRVPEPNIYLDQNGQPVFQDPRVYGGDAYWQLREVDDKLRWHRYRNGSWLPEEPK